MSYNIETRSVSEFVTDTKIKLPRFQRKSTWSAKQNFELAISIFQEYPVGVVIINDEGHTSWLLDGRQRRTALRDLRANPDLVYEWARKYIKFKPSESEDNVESMFWNTVNQYLQKENYEDGNVSEPESEHYSDEENHDIDKWRQRAGLKTLLDIIIMCHQKRGDTYKWERAFDFRNFLDRASYAPKRDGYKIDPIALREFLLKYRNKVANITIDSFIQFMDDECGLKEGMEVKFKSEIEQKWTMLDKIISIISDSEQRYIDARIGVILLKNVTPLDAQNIFSRINSGGTQLKAEELLSAKPFWNEPVITFDAKMGELVKDMYSRLGVEVPQDGAVVRWDYGATLISRIKDQNLLFENYHTPDNPKEIDVTQITLGFKLMSSYFNGGMSAIVVTEMEKNKDIKWGKSIDELVEDVNTICEILLKTEFFRYFKSWKKSIFKLMGNAIVLEFITILVKDWHSKGCPTIDSAELKNFKRDAKILLDRLMYEYAVGGWKGSGDSKMANHIKNWKERIKPLERSVWETFIEESSNGSFGGQPLDIKHLTPILCYQYALRKLQPENCLDEPSEVDHIIPQDKLNENQMIPKEYKDSLFNLILLSKTDNIQKKDKALNEIKDSFLRKTVSKYSFIDECDFDKFSDISNIKDLKEKRMAELLKVFGDVRISELSN